MTIATIKPAGTSKTLLSRLCRILGEKGRVRLVRYSAPCLRAPHAFALPLDLKTARRVAVLLPEDPFDALLQMNTVLAVVHLFHRADIVIICECRVAAFFGHVQGIKEIVTYKIEGRYLFSREFMTLGGILALRQFDVCLLLERNPDISLLHLMVRMSPKVRVGYAGASDYPFLNVRIRAQGTSVYVPDQNFILAEALGARRPAPVRWSVSKQSREEIQLLLREFRIPGDAKLAGIEAGSLAAQCGREWTQMLVNTLMRQAGYLWYLYFNSAPEQSFLERLVASGIPAFSSLSASRSAALVQRSSIVISGKAVLFVMAHILARPVIGIYEHDDAQRYCKPSPLCMVVPYRGNPDDRTVRQVSELVGAGSASG